MKVVAEKAMTSSDGAYCTCPNERRVDGASIPRALQWLYHPFGRYLEAAVVHDCFCVLGHNGTSPIDSVKAAEVFREAMKVCGVSKWRRQKMYLAVRWFGPQFKAKHDAQ